MSRSPHVTGKSDRYIFVRRVPLLIVITIRCTRTGRKCDGYTSQPPARNCPVHQTSPVAEDEASRNLSLVLPTNTEKSLATISVTKLEHHALDYFFNHTARLMGVYYDPIFWNRVVLQL